MASYINRLIGMKPLAYWPMNDAASPAVDLTGNGRNLTFTGVTWGQPGIGDGLTAADFNGTSAYGALLTGANWINGTSGTLSLWMKLAAGTWTDATTRIIARFSGDGTTNNYLEFTRTTTNNRLQLAVVTGGSSKILTYDTAAPTNWLNMMFTWTASTITMYANEAQVAINSTRSGSWVSNSSAYVNLGAQSFWHKGGLGGVIVFDRALDATQRGLVARVSVPEIAASQEITRTIVREGKL